MMPPSSLALATPRGGRPPTARQSRFRGGKLDLEHNVLFDVLQTRFAGHRHRHVDIAWGDVQARLGMATAEQWRALAEMDSTGGEPDVVGRAADGAVVFCDCAAESPVGRRSLCFDDAALAARKQNKPRGSAAGMAAAMGIALLSEEQYRALQALQPVDLKTSSWIDTPASIRQQGGALFGDRRYGTVFTYHNGAESYYAARGFRGALAV